MSSMESSPGNPLDWAACTTHVYTALLCRPRPPGSPRVMRLVWGEEDESNWITYKLEDEPAVANQRVINCETLRALLTSAVNS